MALLSRKGLLAIAAVIDVALHERGRPVSAKALAARHSLPARNLEPVLQALVRFGILKGIRGPRGGYELARERRRITADDILRAAGTIDADYRGEIHVIIVNLGDAPFEIERGIRIAQLIIAPVCRAQLAELKTLDKTARGSGGFGSTSGMAIDKAAKKRP